MYGNLNTKTIFDMTSQPGSYFRLQPKIDSLLYHIPFPLGKKNENKKERRGACVDLIRKIQSMQLLLPNIVTNAAILFGKHHKNPAFSSVCLCMRITSTIHLHCAVYTEWAYDDVENKRDQLSHCRVKRTEIKTFRYNQNVYILLSSIRFFNIVIWPVGHRSRMKRC